MAPTRRVRVLVLHDDPIARAGLCAGFRKFDDLEVVNDDDVEGREKPEPSTLGTLDVIVADHQDGVDLALRGSDRRRRASRIVIVSSCDQEWAIRSALRHGVQGYVLAGATLNDLAASVRTVHGGMRYLCPRSAQRMADCFCSQALTEREEDVLRLVVDGMCNKSISRCLGIAVGTVKAHLKSVFEKLHVQSRAQAIGVAVRRGLLQQTAPTGR